MEILGAIPALLVYSGPALPALALVVLRIRRGVVFFKKTLLALVLVHAAAYVPVVLGATCGWTDYLLFLIFPVLTGLLSLLIGTGLFVAALVKVSRGSVSTNAPS